VLRPVGIGTNQEKPKIGPDTENKQLVAESAEPVKAGQGYTERSRPRNSRSMSRTVAARLKGKAPDLLLRTRDKASCVWVASWMVLFFAPQIGLGLLGIIAFGTTYAIDQMASSNGGILGFLANKTLEAFNAITSLIGIDFSSIAADMMMLMLVTVLAIGIASLFTAILLFLTRGIKPLSGEGAGLKQGMFLLAIIGYSMPLVNIFPWVLLYIIAVWRHPR
jgi:hypothetical protein